MVKLVSLNNDDDDTSRVSSRFPGFKTAAAAEQQGRGRGIGVPETRPLTLKPHRPSHTSHLEIDQASLPRA